MSVRVIAEFPAAPGKLTELSAALQAALTETRAFEGCEVIESWLDAERETIVLVESWSSFEDYDRYLAWRVEGGILDLFDALLAGGRAGFVPRKLVPAGC
ncbi:MAG: antibiotic biosynthesis monooxygenase family protein [Sphingomicrobium sp.]